MTTLEQYRQAVAALSAKGPENKADASYLHRVQQRHGAAVPSPSAPVGTMTEKYLQTIQRLNSTRPWAGSEEPEALGRQTKDLIRSGGGVLYL